MKSMSSIVLLIVYPLIWVETFARTPNKWYPGEHCKRQCYENKNRICYFEFAIEYYQTMGLPCGNCMNGTDSDCNQPKCVVADGFEKGFMSINRQLPGPPIQICRNDIVVVDVKNMAEGTATTIHWHGLDQREQPYMDGVPFVTQCPIPFSTTFRYQFSVPEFGTFFYHSHSGFHRVNGVHGAFIVREPSKVDDPYDFDLPEHYRLISDWLHTYAEQLFPSLTQEHGVLPDSVLINGIGTYLNGTTGQRIRTPPPHYYFVEAGKSFRFRVIDAGSFVCPVQLQVENHSLILIASDGHPFEPRTFDTLVLNAGERYDFVLNATQTPGDYWIRVRGLGACSADTLTETFAVLRYKTNSVTDRTSRLPPLYNDTYPDGTVLNYPNGTCLDQGTDVCITALHAVKTDESLRTSHVDYRFYLGFGNHKRTEKINSGAYEKYAILADVPETSAINNISMNLPSSPPLTQPDDVDEREYCDRYHRPARCKGKRFCECVHLIDIELDSIVEFILVDENKRNDTATIHHPIHLHGMEFLVTDMGQHPLGEPMTVSKAKSMDDANMLRNNRSNRRPVWKDTISVPSAGFAILRLRANNPGYWFLHCHYEWHTVNGMAMIVKVGEQDEMESPPDDFPKCGNYLP